MATIDGLHKMTFIMSVIRFLLLKLMIGISVERYAKKVMKGLKQGTYRIRHIILVLIEIGELLRYLHVTKNAGIAKKHKKTLI